MKKNTFKNIVLICVLFAGSCKQETINLQPQPTGPVDNSCATATAGSAVFTKFVAIGSSYTAGFQAGALFTDGQNNSLPAILNKQFQCVGAPATFNQPTINSTLGYNIFVSPNPGANGHVLGRMLLQGASPVPTPQPYAVGDLSAVPNPQLNPGFIYAGTSATLNNFGVEAITLGQYLIPNTGKWADPNPAHGFSPFYARFASDHGAGGSTIIGDAALAGGSFFMFWGGMDDFMLYAANGGDASKAPLTTVANFGLRYGGAIATLLGSNPSLKGVVVNFPDIFVMPHFTSVPWNAIAFTSSATDQANMTGANTAYAAYNGGLDFVFSKGGISATERDQRKINFALGGNGIVIEDKTLTNLSGFGLPSIRQATSADIFPLGAGSVLGTEATPNDPTTTWGVGKALTDQYVLIPSEIDSINFARTAFNATVATTVTTYSSKLALADVNTSMNLFVTAHAAVLNGVTITPNINPPTGIYSEDGLHPNSRGYAYISTIIISAINAKFGSTIPPTNIAQYSATGLPIP